MLRNTSQSTSSRRLHEPTTSVYLHVAFTENLRLVVLFLAREGFSLLLAGSKMVTDL